MPEQNIPGPQGGPLGGGGPEIPGGFSQGPFHGPPEWVSYNVPPELRLGMTDVQQNGTSRGGVPLYQGTDQYGREWQWSERGPIGYRDDDDGIWHEVSEQDGIWHDRWTDQNGWERHSTQDAQGNHLSTTSSHPDIPLSPQDAFTDALKDNVFADPPPPFVEAPPDAIKDNVFADPPPPDGDIQVRLPDAFKDKAVEPPPPWSYGDIQVRPPDAFKDKAVEPPPYQEPPPEEPPVAEPPPPPGDADDGDGGIPGLGVPYRDFIPTFPMVQDPTTGQWRNAEPGEIPGAEGGEEEQLPPVTQTPEAEPPVQPTPPPPYDPANGMPQPDGDGDGIPNEYGDGPDLDGNGVPDEIGINPDMLQDGYPDSPSASDDWGGVGVPDPNVVSPSDSTTTGAEAMPEGYGDGSGLGGNWVPEEAGIDPYALQEPAYMDPSTSGDGTGDPYSDSSFEPYVPPAEAPLEEEAPAVSEGEDPDAPGSF